MRFTSTAWKEARRLRALALQQEGWKQTEIAEALGVTDGAVSQWFSLVDDGNRTALLARPHPGRPPELAQEQKQLIPDLLSHGAEAYGFRGNVWTNARVAKVIEWEWAVNYHRSHVARLLKELGWTPQFHLERLPPYAPDLNPDEGVWNHLKYVELRNVCCLNLGHLQHQLDLALTRLRRRPYLIQSFFAGAGLDL